MIDVRGVKKYFNPKKKELVKAVDGISFQVHPGRVFSILGPNGSGKSTLLRMIATILSPDEGRIEVAGYDSVTDGSEVRKRIGLLTGSAKLHKRLTPIETLDFYGGLYGMDFDLIEERKQELVKELDMESFKNRTVEKLSMGQTQRVMIARTMLHDPEVVIFDEATAGLDVLAAKTMMDIIRKAKEAGKTVIFSTHIMGEVGMLADDVVILHEGEMKYSGTYETLLSEQQEPTMEEEFIRILNKEEKV